MDISVRGLIIRKVKGYFNEEGQTTTLPKEFVSVIFNAIDNCNQDDAQAAINTGAYIDNYITQEYPDYYTSSESTIADWVRFVNINKLNSSVRDVIRDLAARHFDPHYKRFRVPEDFWDEAYGLIIRCKNDPLQITRAARAIDKRVKQSYPNIGSNEVKVSLFIKKLLERL